MNNYLKILAVSATLVVGAITLGWCGVQQGKREQRATIKEADSVRVVNQELKKRVTEAEMRADVEQAVAMKLRESGAASDLRLAKLRFEFEKLSKTLDSIPQATASDSVVVYRMRVANLSGQVVELTIARDTARAEALHWEQQAREFQGAKKLVEDQLKAVEISNANLRRDLATASPSCKVLFVKCPSRTVSFVAGAASIVALNLAIRRP